MLNDKLVKEKNDKADEDADDDDGIPPPPTSRSSTQARGTGGVIQKMFPKDVRSVNMILRGLESKHAQKLSLKEVYSLVLGVP